MDPVAIDPRRIRWIAFDAVDTLIQATPSVAAVYHQVGVRHGSRMAHEQVATRFRQAFSRANEEGALSCGCPETDEAWHTCENRERLRWQTIVETVLADVASREECFDELFAHFGRPSSWTCFPDVEPALVALREAGFRLAISSNFDARLNAVMDGLPPLRPIELRVISSQLGQRKPSIRFFQSLLSLTGCDPAELIFIGDNPQTDVAAANAAGIPALRIDRAAAKGENRLLRSLAEVVEILGKGPKPKP
jgi:putative hydrolase of the HAD superfamily